MSNQYGIVVNWETFKGFISSGIPFKEIILDGSLRLIAIDGSSKFQCIIHTDGDMPTEYAEYQSDYQSKKNKLIENRDDTGRAVVRSAATDQGWAYLAHPIEFKTSTEDSIYSKNHKGEDRGECALSFCDVNNVAITEAGTFATLQERLDAECTTTKLTIKLGIDFDIVSGKLEQLIQPLSDIRMYVLIGIFDANGVPFDPDGPGTAWSEQVTEFVGGINLKYYSASQTLETDGRAGKKLFKIVNDQIPYDQNQIQFILKHPAGFKHDLMPILEYFRKP
tara:strand:+ start:112045 stop:112881 length:837 start_codon:yes stop_codon:yes gene_type:complete